MNKKERLQEEKKKTEQLLKKVGFTGKRGKSYSTLPDYKLDCNGIPMQDTPPCSNNFEPIVDKKKLKQEDIDKVSKKVTIAPAYNKGPYMVISRSDVETAGRKV